MNNQTIRSPRLGEEYTRIDHPSGLTMLLYPMPGYSTAYAMFGTKYGSVDECFQVNGQEGFTTVPSGIAHYLEHKMFESEEGDTFARYAKIGASGNAFTSFDKTAYLFACSGHFQEALEILLDSVTHPYFTKETVEKEQGIIGQEIRMYDDDPEWACMFGLLQGMYHQHPVRVDIAGTVESISHITAELLYQCYDTFYNLHNMVLTVAGNFQVEEVLAAADKVLRPAQPQEIRRSCGEEPATVRQKRTVKKMEVATPLFQIGFKSPNRGETENFRSMILDEMLIDILAGEMTPLYRELYHKGLINNGLDGETMACRDCLCTLFSGESKDPDQVYQRICQEIVRAQKEGLDEELFARTKRATYGRFINMFGKPDTVASVLMNTYFVGLTPYQLLDLVASCTKEDLERRLAEDFDPENSAISLICSDC